MGLGVVSFPQDWTSYLAFCLEIHLCQGLVKPRVALGVGVGLGLEEVEEETPGCSLEGEEGNLGKGRGLSWAATWALLSRQEGTVG